MTEIGVGVGVRGPEDTGFGGNTEKAHSPAATPPTLSGAQEA